MCNTAVAGIGWKAGCCAGQCQPGRAGHPVYRHMVSLECQLELVLAARTSSEAMLRSQTLELGYTACICLQGQVLL